MVNTGRSVLARLVNAKWEVVEQGAGEILALIQVARSDNRKYDGHSTENNSKFE